MRAEPFKTIILPSIILPIRETSELPAFCVFRSATVLEASRSTVATKSIHPDEVCFRSGTCRTLLICNLPYRGFGRRTVTIYRTAERLRAEPFKTIILPSIILPNLFRSATVLEASRSTVATKSMFPIWNVPNTADLQSAVSRISVAERLRAEPFKTIILPSIILPNRKRGELPHFALPERDCAGSHSEQARGVKHVVAVTSLLHYNFG